MDRKKLNKLNYGEYATPRQKDIFERTIGIIAAETNNQHQEVPSTLMANLLADEARKINGAYIKAERRHLKIWRTSTLRAALDMADAKIKNDFANIWYKYTILISKYA